MFISLCLRKRPVPMQLKQEEGGPARDLIAVTCGNRGSERGTGCVRIGNRNFLEHLNADTVHCLGNPLGHNQSLRVRCEGEFQVEGFEVGSRHLERGSCLCLGPQTWEDPWQG